MELTNHTATAETRTGSHKLPMGMTGPPGEEFGGDSIPTAAVSLHCHRGGARLQGYQVLTVVPGPLRNPTVGRRVLARVLEHELAGTHCEGNRGFSPVAG